MKSGKDEGEGCHTKHGTAASVRSSDADAGVELRCKPSSWGLIRYQGEVGYFEAALGDLGERVEEERKKRVRWQVLQSSGECHRRS